MSRLGALLSRVGSLFVQAKQRGLDISPRDSNWDRAVIIPRDKQLTEPFRQNTWVNGCVGAISSRVGLSTFTLRTGKKDKEKVIEDGDLYKAFARPNPNWSSTQLWESASMYLELEGNAIFVLDRNSFTEVPIETWVFGPLRFEPIFAKGSRTVAWWKFRTTGSTWIRLEPYQVVHVSLISPTGAHYGMAPMEAAMYAVRTDWLATGFNESLFTNGFSPGAIISWPEQGPKDMADFKTKFLREHISTPGTTDRRFRLAMLTGGGTYQPLEYSARDAAFIEGRKMGRDEVCVVFRVPVCVLGIGEKAGIIASGTPEAQSLKRFWGGTIKPRLKLLEDAWRTQFFWPFDDERTWPKFDTSEIEELQEERSAQIDRVRVLCTLGVPFNTANEKEGLGYDPIPGGDWGYRTGGMYDGIMSDDEPMPPTPVFPTSVDDAAAAADAKAKADAKAAENPAPVIIPPAAKDEDDPDAEDEEEEDKKGKGKKKAAPTAVPPYVGTCPHCGEIELGSVPAKPWHARAIRPYTDQHVVFCEEWEARVGGLERDFSAKLRNYLLKCRSFLNVKVDDALEASLKVGSLPADFFDLSMSFDEMLRKISKTYFRKVSVEVGPLIESHINGAGVPFVFDPDNPALVKFLETKTIKVVSHVNQEAIREGVRAKLIESQKSNGTMEELRESLLDVIGDNRRRALTIARTETGQATNGLEYTCEKDAGVKTRQWIANRDDKTRDSHLDMMALGDWPIGKPFPNGLMYPGDVNGPPEETINCFVPGTIVSGRFVAGSKAWYSGAICEVVTASGKRVRVTPNHPVLTPDGWRKVGSLREGDYLLSNGVNVDRCTVADGSVDDKQGPAAIQDVYDSMAWHGSLVAKEADFHGDGKFCQGEVEVVDVNGVLMGDGNPESLDRRLDFELEGSNPAARSRLGVRQLPRQRVLSSSSSGPRLGALSLDQGAVAGAVLPDQPVGRRPSTYRNASTLQALADRAPRNAVLPGQRLEADSGLVVSNQGVGVEYRALRGSQPICLGEAANVRAHAGQGVLDGSDADAVFLGELLSRYSGFVVPDKIVSIQKRAWSNHVYDLQSCQGWIIAQGIAFHNCRCRELAIE